MDISGAGYNAAASQAKVQFAIAGKIAKMNAGHERSVAQLVEAGQQNINSLVKGGSSGGLLDISV